jgi:hypothetical protein
MKKAISRNAPKLCALGVGEMQDKWQPISQYKGGNAVFYFEASAPDKWNRNALPATVQLTRNYGHRICTKFLPFELPEKV